MASERQFFLLRALFIATLTLSVAVVSAKDANQVLNEAAEKLNEAYDAAKDRLAPGTEKTIEALKYAADEAYKSGSDLLNSEAAAKAAEALRDATEAIRQAGASAYNSETTAQVLDFLKEKAETVQAAGVRMAATLKEAGDKAVHSDTAEAVVNKVKEVPAAAMSAVDLEAMRAAAERAYHFVGDRLALAYDTVTAFAHDLQRKRVEL